MHTETGHLTPTAPFDFSKSLHFIGNFMPTKNEQRLSGQSLTKAVSIKGHAVAFKLTGRGSIEKPELEYTLFSEQPLTEAVKSVAIDRITFFLSLEDDLKPFYEVALSDPTFAPVLEELYGYHQVKFLTPFEIACWAVLSQRNPMAHAQKVKQALAERFGSGIEVHGVAYLAFPEPAQLIEADPNELMAIIRNERRTAYVGAIARAFDEVDEQFLRTAPYEEVEAWLRSIKGIGEWSANFILLRGLGRMEQVPTMEKTLFGTLSRLYGRGEPLAKEDVQRLAEQYGPYQGYWAHYLRAAT